MDKSNKQQHLDNLEYLFKQDEFQNAAVFYNKNIQYISNEEYFKLYLKYTKRYKDKLIKKAALGLSEFRKLAYRNTNEELYDFIEILDDLVNNLDKFNFKIADELYLNNSNEIKYENYISTKAEYILKYFKDVLPDIKLDSEKAIAIADFNQYQLLDARAGSGKTTTICLRTKLLIEKYGIDPSEILILAFNSCVPPKINDDLDKKYGIKNFKIATTFHAFAASITKNRVDENKTEENIRLAINKVLSDNDAYNKLYEFYKYPLLLDDTFQPNMSNEEFYNLRKNMHYETLDGQKVGSRGEKYIADYLFEHDIPYKCQPRLILNNDERADFGLKCQIYCPDFWIKINNQFYFWEHWAITSLDELDNKKPIENFDPNRYLAGIKIKRKLMQKRNYNLIETRSIDSKSRKDFEKLIDNLLFEKCGFIPKKLSEEEILNKIKKYYKKTKLEKAYEYFIQQIDNRLIDLDELQQKIKFCSKGVANFAEIGILIYKEYSQLKNTPDYNDLIKNATLKIKNNYENCITYNYGNKLENIKYIMIDEYQDFSTLFYRLVESIKLKNPSVNIFCVGDNLQSIYSFAGANKDYFENFIKFFGENASIHSLTMNYRSKYELVQFTNQLAVNKCRALAQSNRINNGGGIYNIKVDATYLGFDSACEINNDTKDKIMAKYLKTCDFIINKTNPNKKILILSRTKYMYDNEISKLFKDKLQYKDLDVLTMHRAKGLEADIVILLNANEGIVPMINTMSETQQIFGVSIKDILDEELRLLYVALTRAKEKIYILNEAHNSSEVIKSLNSKEVYIYNNKLTQYDAIYKKKYDKAEWQEAKKVKFDMMNEAANTLEARFGSEYSWEY